MNDDDLKAFVQRVRSKMTITKVVATRAVKTSRGDFFCGFSAAWDTVQEDGVQGLDSLQEGEDLRGMTTKEAKMAHYLLAMQVDEAAHEAALAGGGLSPQACHDALVSIRGNFNRIIRIAFADKADPSDTESP
jgi:hypothetical protein